jgi:replicative DNA helicase
MSTASGIALQKGLPANIDAERFILGSVLLDDSRFIDIAGVITNADFALEKHRRIYTRMMELHERGEKSTASPLPMSCFAITNWSRLTG